MMPKEQNTPVLELRNITKSFGATPVLGGISLTVKEGEFVTLLGPSGCGKTTILRIIAGLEQPDDGCVLIEGQDMQRTGPEKRPVNMVFQNYALFPHMNVFQNIAYGLKIKGIHKEEIRTRVAHALALVRMEGYEKRMPAEMSGGQRQRVAIARAIINNPRILLLDEPLGALDLQLRRQMQHELKTLQKELGITFIYITHDQEEAINMSDRILVMHNGNIEQAGTPAEIYDTPRTSYVARFVGEANILRGTVTEPMPDRTVLQTAGGRMQCNDVDANPGTPLTLAVRGENISIHRTPQSDVFLQGVITEKTFAGGMLRIAVKLPDDTEVVIRRHGMDCDYADGEDVFLEWPAGAAATVDREAKA